MFLIMLILNDPDRCQELITAWDEAGAPGVTILPSTGSGRVRARMGLKDDIPLMPSLGDFLTDEENLHRTLLCVIRDRPAVDRIIQATHAVLGDLNKPHTGILVVLPVLEAYGLDRYPEE
jgi:hypothetical protein